MQQLKMQLAESNLIQIGSLRMFRYFVSSFICLCRHFEMVIALGFTWLRKLGLLDHLPRIETNAFNP